MDLAAASAGTDPLAALRGTKRKRQEQPREIELLEAARYETTDVPIDVCQTSPVIGRTPDTDLATVFAAKASLPADTQHLGVVPGRHSGVAHHNHTQAQGQRPVGSDEARAGNAQSGQEELVQVSLGGGQGLLWKRQVWRCAPKVQPVIPSDIEILEGVVNAKEMNLCW